MQEWISKKRCCSEVQLALQNPATQNKTSYPSVIFEVYCTTIHLNLSCVYFLNELPIHAKDIINSTPVVIILCERNNVPKSKKKCIALLDAKIQCKVLTV